MDNFKMIGQPYPTFSTQAQFTLAKESKEEFDFKDQGQGLRSSQDLEPGIIPNLQHDSSNPFYIDQSEINKVESDSTINVQQRGSDLQNAFMMLDNTNYLPENINNVSTQMPYVKQRSREDNHETLKQLREFLVDQIEETSLNEIYKNYGMLTNYCLKQQFLLQNRHFDPKQYFQGRKISNSDFKDVFPERKASIQVTSQRPLNTQNQPNQRQSRSQSNEKQISQKNSISKQRQISQLDHVKELKEESHSGSATPNSPAQINTIILGNYAKYPQQAITPIKKNSINLSSASTKLGFQASSGANSYLNNSNQAIDMSRSLLQSKNLTAHGSSNQNIHNLQDQFPSPQYKDEGNSKGENVNTQNIQLQQQPKQINLQKTQQKALIGSSVNNQFSPKSKLEQQINLFETSGSNTKNKNYISFIRDYQTNGKPDNIKTTNSSGIPNSRAASSTSLSQQNSPLQNPQMSLLKNVQINLFATQAQVSNTDNQKKQENSSMSASKLLRSSNRAASPSNSKSDQMKNSLGRKDKTPTVIKQNEIVTSPLPKTIPASTRKEIVKFNLNSRLSPKHSSQSSRVQQISSNKSLDNDKRFESNRLSQNTVTQDTQKQEGIKKQIQTQEKARKSISIHLDQPKYYQYNNQQPIVTNNIDNKSQLSVDLKGSSNSKLQSQSTKSSSLLKEQLKQSSEMVRFNKVMDFNKYTINGISEYNTNGAISAQNQAANSNCSSNAGSSNKLHSDTIPSSNNNNNPLSNLNSRSTSKHQQHKTIPLIKALNLSKVSSQAHIGDENGSQREIKEYAISAANSRNVSPTNQLKDKKAAAASPGNNSLNNSQVRMSSSLQPTPRNNNHNQHHDQQMQSSIINQNDNQQIAKNIASVISILNNKVKKENQSLSTLRAINQMMSVKKTPLSPSQRSLSRGQTNIGTPLPSGYQYQQDINMKSQNNGFPTSNFSNQQLHSAQSSLKNLMNQQQQQPNPNHGQIFQPQLNSKYTQIYQQMEQLNQKFYSVGTYQQMHQQQQQQQGNVSIPNSNNVSQIFLNQPTQSVLQPTLNQIRNSSKNNQKMQKKNI